MGDSRIYLLLGESLSKGKGLKNTDGKAWGYAHVIPDNQAEPFDLKSPPAGNPKLPDGVSKLESTNLIPVMTLSHNIRRTGNIAAPHDPGGISYGNMMLTVHPWMAVRMAGIVKNLFGDDAKGNPNRCHFKLYFTRAASEKKGSKQEQHVWMVISGSNGQILSVNDGLVDDYLSVVLSADVWRWQTFDTGTDTKHVASANWDATGKNMSSKNWC